VEEVQARMAQLRPESAPLWGTMNPAQALAHCALALKWAVGDRIPPRMWLGRIMGRMVKPMVLRNDAPMRRNSPTAKDLAGLLQRSTHPWTAIRRWFADRRPVAPADLTYVW
jgi:hypothetical protein